VATRPPGGYAQRRSGLAPISIFVPTSPVYVGIDVACAVGKWCRSAWCREGIEVYPFAIVRALLPACEHKSTEDGYRDQLIAVSARTGWEPQKLEARLKATVPGSRHDRLDAFMAAWVASLPPGRRRAFGNAQQPDDAIWVPL
jgi:hypothetical protein